MILRQDILENSKKTEKMREMAILASRKQKQFEENI